MKTKKKRKFIMFFVKKKKQPKKSIFVFALQECQNVKYEVKMRPFSMHSES